MDIVKECADNYGITIKSFKALAGGWLNEKYILHTDDKKYVLKQISEKKFPLSYIEKIIFNSLQLQNSLQEKGIPCPRVLKSKHGLMPILSNGEYFFLMEYVFGDEKDYKTISLDEIKSLGYFTGLMHETMKNNLQLKFEESFLHLKYPDELEKDLFNRRSEINANTPKSFIKDIESHENIIRQLKSSLFLEKQPLQIIHGDFTPDNIKFCNDKISGIFDLELVRYNSKLQDVGRVILSTTFDGIDFDFVKIKKFIEGYNLSSTITQYDIVSAMKIVWSNEVDLWIKERYYRNYNPPKVTKFMLELNWITQNWFILEEYFTEGLEVDEKRYTRQRK